MPWMTCSSAGSKVDTCLVPEKLEAVVFELPRNTLLQNIFGEGTDSALLSMRY